MSCELNPPVIAEAIFSLTATLATLAPRPDPKDKSFFGGELSRPFRRAMVFVTVTLTVRNLILPKRQSSADCSPNETFCGAWIAAWYIVGVVGSVLLGFLNLCMPYLIQVRLSQVTNISPGRNLTVWLAGIMCLTFLAAVLSATVAPGLWALKPLGDALYGVPAIRTILLYDRVLGGRDKSRSLVQTLLVLEVAHLTSAAGAGLLIAGGMGRTSIGFQVRLAWTFLRWLMLLVQSMLLNLMDEQQHHCRQRQQGTEETTRHANGPEVEIKAVGDSESVALVVHKN